MTLALGFLLVLTAGFFQGTFILPMTLTKNWSWEHTWFTFSLAGMLVLNWVLALLLIPDLFAVYASVPVRDLVVLSLFGAGWGIGAVLFGLGMDRLGMALGYPIIMGLIASLGALVPLVVFYPETLWLPRGLVMLAGTVLVIAGIVLSARAAVRKAPAAAGAPGAGGLRTGVAIAVAAGILSCLPNVGFAFGSRVVEAAAASGVSEALAGNAVWALFFTLGFLVNAAYCLFLMVRRGTLGAYFGAGLGRNLGLGLAMGLMWIGSFYLYGVSAAQLGFWGVVVGWPVFIALSIVVGNLWGMWRGEWKGAPAPARRLLGGSLALMTLAIAVIAFSNTL